MDHVPPCRLTHDWSCEKARLTLSTLSCALTTCTALPRAASKSIQSLGDRDADTKRFAQAAALAKDALQRELIALQSNMDDADLAKQAEDHMDSVSSSREQSRYHHLSYRR